ncbi:MAG: tetratricopeptide repeat protein, partial [Rhizobacter sp.]|nr:tetratricopeptide repeat protein [Rhizobacter sp.]
MALALPLAACAPTLELPADMRADAGLQELIGAAYGGPAMQRIVAEQMQIAQRQRRELEAEEALLRAETVEYVYRPSPALFHQSVLIDTFDPVGFDAQMHASPGDADEDDDADDADDTRAATRRPPPRNAAGRPGAAAPARANAQARERLWHEQREILRAGGDPQRELATFRRILAEREAMFGAVHAQVAPAIGNLGVALAAAGDEPGARALLDRAVAMTEQTLGPAHPEVATALDRLAAFHLQHGAPAAAAPLYERALAIRTNAPRLSRRLVPATLNNLGVVSARLGEAGRARDFYERAFAGYEAALRQASARALDLPERLVLEPDRPVVLSNLGVLAWQQGQTEQAIAAFARARETYNAMLWAGFDTLSEAQQLAMMGTLAEEVEALAALEHGFAAGRPDATR